MTGDDFAKALGCLLAWREENTNGVNGMLAVLFVLNNRTKHAPADGFKNNWVGNIAAHNQFSSMTVLGDGQTVHYPDVREPNFIKLLSLVDSTFDGTLDDKLTAGALYYADLASPSYTHGGWFDRNIVQKPDTHPVVSRVGTTTFFR